MRANTSPPTQVKAAGGIRTLDALLEVMALGVTRVGATTTAAMLDEFKARKAGGRRGRERHRATRATRRGVVTASTGSVTDASIVAGRLVLADRVVAGRIVIEDGAIAAVETDEGASADASLPYLAPGFVDVHVHGGGGHDAMGDRAALDGMARHLLRRGVTAFLPTAVTAPIPTLAAFAERVRDWLPDAPGRRRRAARVQPRGPVPRECAAGRPRPDAPARPRGRRA